MDIFNTFFGAMSPLESRLLDSDNLPDDLFQRLVESLAQNTPYEADDHQSNLRALEGYAQVAAGFVYFLLSHDTGQIKIGFSKHVERRVQVLKTAAAKGATCLGVLLGTRALERRIHQMYAVLRTKGEWFHGRSELLGFIDRYSLPIDDDEIQRRQLLWRPVVRNCTTRDELLMQYADVLRDISRLRGKEAKDRFILDLWEKYPEAKDVGEVLALANMPAPEPDPPPVTPSPMALMIGGAKVEAIVEEADAA